MGESLFVYGKVMAITMQMKRQKKVGQRQTSVDEFLRFSRKCGIDGT